MRISDWSSDVCSSDLALPLLETGAADRFGFTPQELAIVCASHNGEDHHVRLVEGILRQIGLGTAALRGGPHAPSSEERRVGTECFGKCCFRWRTYHIQKTINNVQHQQTLRKSS